MAPTRVATARPHHAIVTWPHLVDIKVFHLPGLHNILRTAIITVLVVAVLLSPTYVPLAWGWRFHYTASDRYSFSLLDEKEGVPPLSVYWVGKATPKPGDYLSYEYLERYVNGDAPLTGEVAEPTIKQVESVEVGRIKVHGLYLPTTTPPHWVPASAVGGVIIAGPVTLVPRAFWRWYTLNYTLDANDMELRQARIRRALAGSPFSIGGRLRVASMAPRSVDFRKDRKYCVIHDDDRELLYVARPDGSVIAERHGKFSDWKSDRLVYVNTQDQQRLWVFTPESRMDRREEQSKLQVMGVVSQTTGDQVDLLGDVVSRVKGKNVVVGGHKVRVLKAELVQFGLPLGVLTLLTIKPRLDHRPEMGESFTIVD